MDQEKNLNEQNAEINEPIENGAPQLNEEHSGTNELPKESFLKSVWKFLTASVKRIICFAGISVAILAVAVFFLTLSLHQPVKMDESSGIAVSVPKDAVSMFQKMGLDLQVEEQKKDSQTYTKAKSLLNDQTSEFVLFDMLT